MSKINVEFDTSTKEMVVTIDGKAVENIYSVSAYRDSYDGESKSCICLCTTEKSGEGYRTQTQISAKDTSMGRELLSKGAGSVKEYPDLVALKGVTPKVEQDIAKFLSRKK